MGELLVLPPETSSNCAEVLNESQQCSMTCPESLRSIGYFTCSHGVFVVESLCMPVTQKLDIHSVIKVAGSMDVSVETLTTVSYSTIVEALRQGIAAALGVSREDLVKLVVLDMHQERPQGNRRLRAKEIRQYE